VSDETGGGAGGGPPESAQHEDGEHPKGTLFLMLLFLIAMVAMWGYIYVLMLQAA
jgi:hypothetical protein